MFRFDLALAAKELVLEVQYNLACSARSGCGNLGLAPGLSTGVFRRGRLQLVAHQREAYLGVSHILAHPPWAFDIAQWQ
jgi:hypothetical protein